MKSKINTFKDYQDYARVTAIYPGRHSITGLCYATLGLGEVGEVQNKVKKILRDHGGEIPEDFKVEIAKELGDVLWYVAAISDELGLDMQAIAQNNIEKLQSRKDRGVLKGSGDNR